MCFYHVLILCALHASPAGLSQQQSPPSHTGSVCKLFAEDMQCGLLRFLPRLTHSFLTGWICYMNMLRRII
ncbi:hypothetical protein INR49_002133 [Caranx melampygus]|nr:hypothetical protein INR49_002133 [Caranx melampygus]